MSVVAGLLFSHWARQLNFQEASFFVRFERCACGTGVEGRCTLIDKQHAGWKEKRESRLVYFLLSSSGYFSRGGATASSVRPFPAEVVEVIPGRSLVSLGCWQSQPSSKLSSSRRFQIGSLFHRSSGKGVLDTTKWQNFKIFLHPLDTFRLDLRLNSVPVGTFWCLKAVDQSTSHNLILSGNVILVICCCYHPLWLFWSAKSSHLESFWQTDLTSIFPPLHPYSDFPISAIPLLLFQLFLVVWGCVGEKTGGERKIRFVIASVRRMTPCVSNRPCFPRWDVGVACYFTILFCCGDDCCFPRNGTSI